VATKLRVLGFAPAGLPPKDGIHEKKYHTSYSVSGTAGRIDISTCDNFSMYLRKCLRCQCKRGDLMTAFAKAVCF